MAKLLTKAPEIVSLLLILPQSAKKRDAIVETEASTPHFRTFFSPPALHYTIRRALEAGAEGEMNAC